MKRKGASDWAFENVGELLLALFVVGSLLIIALTQMNTELGLSSYISDLLGHRPSGGSVQ